MFTPQDEVFLLGIWKVATNTFVKDLCLKLSISRKDLREYLCLLVISLKISYFEKMKAIPYKIKALIAMWVIEWHIINNISEIEMKERNQMFIRQTSRDTQFIYTFENGLQNQSNKSNNIFCLKSPTIWWRCHLQCICSMNNCCSSQGKYFPFDIYN